LGNNAPKSAILLIYCKDKSGIVNAVTDFIFNNGGNILQIEWDLKGFEIKAKDIGNIFDTQVSLPFEMQWQLSYSDDVPRMALFVSSLPHCFYDILARYESGEWQLEIPLIISNHPELEVVAKRFGIDYYCLPVTAENKKQQEARQLELLAQYKIDFIVLARYMQILSGSFIEQYPQRIINIHHSFLPAFPGSKPYHSAHERGKGRDLEKIVLSRAIWNQLGRNILVCGNKTVVFD